MSKSHDDPNKVGSYSRLSPEEDKAEDEELKVKIFSNLHQSHAQYKKPAVKRNRPRRANNNDGVTTLGICPVCGNKLGRIIDRYGIEMTVCEKHEEGCRFYTPYRVSHFKSAKNSK